VGQAGATQAGVGVESSVLPVGAGAELRGEPTAGVDAAAADASEVGKWGHDGTLSDTSVEHYRMELPQASSSLPPCGRGTHHPRGCIAECHALRLLCGKANHETVLLLVIRVHLIWCILHQMIE
jgi:hypothetical protein